MIIEPDLITFPTYKIYPDLDIGELEEEIYYDDEIIEYEPEIYFLADKAESNVELIQHLTPKTENYRELLGELPGELLEK